MLIRRWDGYNTLSRVSEGASRRGKDLYPRLLAPLENKPDPNHTKHKIIKQKKNKKNTELEVITRFVLLFLSFSKSLTRNPQSSLLLPFPPFLDSLVLPFYRPTVPPTTVRTNVENSPRAPGSGEHAPNHPPGIRFPMGTKV
jgi:hypothetical protein